MKLYEHEGKKLLRKYKIPIPAGRVFSLSTKSVRITGWPQIVKVQTLSGGRSKAGLIKKVNNQKQLQTVLKSFKAQIHKREKIKKVLIEEALQIRQELYLSLTYNQQSRQPIIMLSSTGGVEIEKLAKQGKVAKLNFSLFQGLQAWQIRQLLFVAKIKPELYKELTILIKNLYKLFTAEDAFLVEINPLVLTRENQLVACDAKVMLDDDGSYRHEKRKFEERTGFGRKPTKRELAAKKIDQGELYYRGTASKYYELDGDIATLFSGGGASLSNMDALISAGGQPANYSEFSGNPEREKVYQLTKIVISKPGIKGLWIAGGMANFTRIDETLAGVAQAIKEIKPKFPIVVRRAGPYDQRGLKTMRDLAKLGFNIKVFGAEINMSETAKLIVELSQPKAQTVKGKTTAKSLKL